MLIRIKRWVEWYFINEKVKQFNEPKNLAPDSLLTGSACPEFAGKNRN